MPSHPNCQIDTSSHCATLVCCLTSEKFELLARKVLWGENSPSMCLRSFPTDFCPSRNCVLQAPRWGSASLPLPLQAHEPEIVPLYRLSQREISSESLLSRQGLRNPFKGIRNAAKCNYWPLCSALDLLFLFQNQYSDTMWKFLHSRNPYCNKTKFTSPTWF